MLARQVDGQWAPFTGSDTFVRMSTEAIVTRHDGSQEPVTVAPYPLEVTLTANEVLESWSDGELAEYGLARIRPFETPDGMRAIGLPRYVQPKGGGPVDEIFDTEDIPPPEPVKEPTAREKLAMVGLTVDDLRGLLFGDE